MWLLTIPGAVKILVCVGTVRPVFDDAYLIFPPYKFPGEHFFRKYIFYGL